MMQNFAARRTAACLATAFALLVLVLATVQGAVAQTAPGCDVIGESELKLTGTISAPIEPIEGEEVLTIEYEYRASETAWTQQSVRISFNVMDVPSWANAVLSPPEVFVDLETAGPTSEKGSIEVRVTVSADAPAYEKTPFTVTAEAEAGTCVAGSEASTSMDITPGFFERWSARAEQSVFMVSLGETVSLEISVHNEGNGAIEIGFEQAEPIPNGKLVLPEGMHVIGSEKQGGEALRTFEVQYKATERGIQDVQVSIAGHSVDDTTMQLEPDILKIKTKTRPGIGEVPPIPVFLVFVPLLAVVHRFRETSR